MGCIWDKTWPCFRDRLTHNDIIGTTYLCMSKISAPGGELEGKGRRQDVAHGACPRSRAACCWLGLVLAGRKERPGRALPGHRGWGRSRGGRGQGAGGGSVLWPCWIRSLLLRGPTDLRVLMGPWGGVVVELQPRFCDLLLRPEVTAGGDSGVLLSLLPPLPAPTDGSSSGGILGLSGWGLRSSLR